MSLARKLLVIGLALPLASAAIGHLQVGVAQEKPAAKKEAKAPKGRLPAYYASVVTEEQRTKIYEIQAKHQKAIDALKEQLEAAGKALEAEIEAVLSAEQKAKVEAAREAANSKKKKAADTEKKPEDK
ncbi:MAG: hypothetical protein SFU86_02120 [Pirellulaceae bacterium]|nr:hypothetical protein [Pirellulaceae bacterium]